MRLGHVLCGKYSDWLKFVSDAFSPSCVKSVLLLPWKFRSGTYDAFNLGASFRDAIDCIEAAYDLRDNESFAMIDGESNERVELCSLFPFHLLSDELFVRNDVFSSLSTSLSSDASDIMSESMRWKLVFWLLLDWTCFLGNFTKFTIESINDVHTTVNCELKSGQWK